MEKGKSESRKKREKKQYVIINKNKEIKEKREAVERNKR